MTNLLYLYGDTYYSCLDELLSYVVGNGLEQSAIGETIEVWKMKLPNYESFFKNNVSYKNMLDEFRQWIRHLGGEDYYDTHLEKSLSNEAMTPLLTKIFKDIMKDNILLDDKKLYDITITKELIMEYV